MRNRCLSHYAVVSLLLTTLILLGTPRAVASQTSIPTQKLMPVWRVLLLVYPSIDADYTDSDGSPRHLTYTMSRGEILAGLKSFHQYASITHNYSNTEAVVQYDIIYISRPITSLTWWGTNIYWVSPSDTRQETDIYAPPGKYDSVFVFWPQYDLITGQHIPTGGWGLSSPACNGVNGATYATVPNSVDWWWHLPTVGEIWLHEWLHGVCRCYSNRGYAMPAGDPDGGDSHGYSSSPTDGWAAYYRDLMTGRVPEAGVHKGISAAAWRSGTILGQSKQVLADYFYSDTTTSYEKIGTAVWQNFPAQEQYIALGNSVAGDNKIYVSASLGNQFTATGRIYIPDTGVGAFDSVALALRNDQVEYWAILLYGTGLPPNMKDTVSISRNDVGGEYFPLTLTPGWYTIKALVDYSSGNMSVKAWQDGSDEPSSFQISSALDPGWMATKVGFRHYGQGTRVDDLLVVQAVIQGPYQTYLPAI